MFLGVGRHAREDLPQLVAQLRADHPHLHLDLQAAVGEDERLVHLLADMAVGHAVNNAS
jgi:sirohydrochlorin cobaltochelatase